MSIGARPRAARGGAGGRRSRAAANEAATLYIKQVAELADVSTYALRAWEADGLLAPARTHSGYRVYSAADVQRVRDIRRLMAEGLNAAGVRHVLQGPAPARRHMDGHPTHALTLGDRLQAARRRAGISIRHLASVTGLSASYISALERDHGRPSVASLQRLAAGLGTNMLHLLGEQPRPDASPVVRADERPPIPTGVPGVRFDNLARVASELEPMMISLDPGCGSAEAYRHAGEEFIFMLAGEMVVALDDGEEHHLRAGDAMTFGSERGHRWWNPSATETAVSVWVNTPPTF